jgi:hypothetical protein
MTELYLILHKVRGEPAFDVAQKIMIGEEEGWIIPTSGHRAYPVTWELLTQHPPNLADSNQWTNLPDHYDTKRDSTQYYDQAIAVLRRKGLIRGDLKGLPPMFRRA